MSNPFEEQNEEKGLRIFVSNPSKTNIENIANQVIKAVKEKDEDYLETYIQAKAMEDLAKKISDGLKPDAMDVAGKLNDKEKFMGCTVSVKSGANKYSFDHNPEWVMIKERIDADTKRLKEIEKEMIGAVGYAEIVKEDGEVIIPANLVEHGANILSVTLPK